MHQVVNGVVKKQDVAVSSLQIHPSQETPITLLVNFALSLYRRSKVNNSIMNAEQARQKAESVRLKQYDKVVLSIEAAVGKGLYEVWFYEPMAQATINKLQAEGYKVGNTLFDRNEYLTKITW